MTFIYYVWYYNVTGDDDYNDSLFHDGGCEFNGIIAINPHNLHIVEVSCYNKTLEDEQTLYRCDTNEERSQDDHDDYIDSICKIKEAVNDIIEEWECDPLESDELMHLVDLWFTKFVPHE